MTDYREDCCWNQIRDLCRGAGCACRCHSEHRRVPRHEWELTRIQDFERLEAEIARLESRVSELEQERSKWHSSYMGAVRLAERSGIERDDAAQQVTDLVDLIREHGSDELIEMADELVGEVVGVPETPLDFRAECVANGICPGCVRLTRNEPHALWCKEAPAHDARAGSDAPGGSYE